MELDEYDQIFYEQWMLQNNMIFAKGRTPFQLTVQIYILIYTIYNVDLYFYFVQY